MDEIDKIHEAQKHRRKPEKIKSIRVKVARKRSYPISSIVQINNSV